MNRLIKSFGVAGLLVAPFMAFAQTPPAGTQVGGPTVFNLLATIAAIMNVVIPILITLAVLYTIWGVIKYATAKESEDQSEGRRVIISGIIGLFVIVSIWGLVAVLNSTFVINQGGPNINDPNACPVIGYTSTGDPMYPNGC